VSSKCFASFAVCPGTVNNRFKCSNIFAKAKLMTGVRLHARGQVMIRELAIKVRCNYRAGIKKPVNDWLFCIHIN